MTKHRRGSGADNGDSKAGGKEDGYAHDLLNCMLDMRNAEANASSGMCTLRRDMSYLPLSLRTATQKVHVTLNP